jgi:HEAT repeat protein
MLREFLHAGDLDELRGAYDELEPLSADDQVMVAQILAAWTDVQAVANLLMYPMLLDGQTRGDWLLRGLSDPEPYLRLAAAVGVGQVLASAWSEDEVALLVPALVQLVADDNAVTASRAALSLVPLARPTDAPDLAAMLSHPDRGVRRNLECALLRSVGSEGLAAILSGGFLDEQTAEAARRVLDADGVDLTKPAEEQRRMPSAAYIPNCREWAAQPD